LFLFKVFEKTLFFRFFGICHSNLPADS